MNRQNRHLNATWDRLLRATVGTPISIVDTAMAAHRERVARWDHPVADVTWRTLFASRYVSRRVSYHVRHCQLTVLTSAGNEATTQTTVTGAMCRVTGVVWIAQHTEGNTVMTESTASNHRFCIPFHYISSL